MWSSVLWLTTSLLLVQRATAQSISPISTKGSKLYDDDGAQFYVKGVVYQKSETESDVLVDTDQCTVDAGMMKTLGANTIYVYYVDPTQDHDGCMQAFASQGIYVWVTMSSTSNFIDRADPSWNMISYNHYAAVIDTFAGYDNTLAFAVGNEVINGSETANAAPYLKAAARDMKAYRNARGYRSIPIGYSTADINTIRKQIADYLVCGVQDNAIDIYGMNVYSWCGNSSYTESGYDTLYTEFQDYNIPVFFSEVGCNVDEPRPWSDVSTMLGPIFQAIFSGAIAYEWTEQDNDYGLVTYSASANTGFPTTLTDFVGLSSVFATATPTGTSASDYTPSNSVPACPTTNSDWSIAGTHSLPTIAQLNIATVSRVTTYISSNGTSTSTTATSTTSAATATSTSTTGTTGTTTKTSVSLSTGAIAGIAVGGAVVGIGAIALAIFLVLRRRRRANAAKKAAQNSPHDNSAFGGKAELQGESVQPSNPKSELDSTQVGPRAELYGTQKTELDAYHDGTRKEIARKPVESGPNEYAELE